jgi:hypothetical protein
MVRIVRHCQPKGAETDMPDLNYLRHYSTRLPIAFQGQQNLERGKGQYLHHVSEERKERGLSATGGLETPEKFRELQRKLYQKAKQETAKAYERR